MTTMTGIQRYAKTPRAWEALARPDAVGRQAHTLLLMANGRRSEQELSLLLGTDVTALAIQLRQGGYLQLQSLTSVVAAEADDDTLTRV
jgi:hypothetical protein